MSLSILGQNLSTLNSSASLTSSRSFEINKSLHSLNQHSPPSLKRFYSKLLNKWVSIHPEEKESIQPLLEIFQRVQLDGTHFLQNALYKNHGYLNRLFSTESWEEWVENRTSLGIVIENLVDYLNGDSYKLRPIISRLNIDTIRKANQQAKEILVSIKDTKNGENRVHTQSDNLKEHSTLLDSSSKLLDRSKQPKAKQTTLLDKTRNNLQQPLRISRNKDLMGSRLNGKDTRYDAHTEKTLRLSPAKPFPDQTLLALSPFSLLINSSEWFTNSSIGGSFPFLELWVFEKYGKSEISIPWMNIESSPQLLSKYNNTFKPNDVVVSGNTAFLADSLGLQIINITNPKEPTLISRYPSTGVKREVFALAVLNNTVFIHTNLMDNNVELQTIDVNDLTHPVLLGNYPTGESSNGPFGTRGISVSGNTAFVAAGANGLFILDVRNRTHPTLLSHYPITSGKAQNVAISPGNFAALTCSGSRMLILNISNITNPTLHTSYSGGAKDFQNVEFHDSGGLLLTVNSSLLYVNLAHSGPPIGEVHSFPYPAQGLTTSGNGALTFVSGSRMIAIMDQFFLLRGYYYSKDLQETIWNCRYYNNALFAVGDGGLSIIDTSFWNLMGTPPNCSWIGNYSMTLIANGLEYRMAGASSDFIMQVMPPLTLVNNTLIINQGENTVLTGAQLGVVNLSPNLTRLTFNVSELQHGYFSFIDNPSFHITQFSEQNITDKIVQFSHDGTCWPPSYLVKAFDTKSGCSTLEKNATIHFNWMKPTIVNNTLNIDQGKKIVFTNTQLGVANSFSNLNRLTFYISELQHGHFSFIDNPLLQITQFSEQNITDEVVQFSHDGTCWPPSYSVKILESDSGCPTIEKNATIYFNSIKPIILIHPEIRMTPGKPLNSINLNVYDPGDDSPKNLVFNVSDVLGEITCNNPTRTDCTLFTQQDINNGNVYLLPPSGSDRAVFSVSAQDTCGLVSEKKLVTIGFVQNDDHGTNNNTIRNAIIGGTVTGVIGLGFFAAKLYIERKAMRAFNEAASAIFKSEAENEVEAYDRDVFQQVAKKIRASIKITGCLGYINKKTADEYVNAVNAILKALYALNEEQLDLRNKDPHERNYLLNLIGREVRKVMLGEESCCCNSACTCKAEVTPQQLQHEASNIAKAIKDALEAAHADLLVSSHPKSSEMKEADIPLLERDCEKK